MLGPIAEGLAASAMDEDHRGERTFARGRPAEIGKDAGCLSAIGLALVKNLLDQPSPPAPLRRRQLFKCRQIPRAAVARGGAHRAAPRDQQQCQPKKPKTFHHGLTSGRSVTDFRLTLVSPPKVAGRTVRRYGFASRRTTPRSTAFHFAGPLVSGTAASSVWSPIRTAIRPRSAEHTVSPDALLRPPRTTAETGRHHALAAAHSVPQHGAARRRLRLPP